MAEQNSQQGRRPHLHRGRRGQEKRGNERSAERRTTPQGQEAPAGRDTVDVEQIMRDIRARISQRHGIDLSTQQIQELAARRLEAILEPRNLKPALMEQLRRGAGEPPEVAPAADGYTFEDTTLYETHRGILRFFRRLLHPILKLFFNPTPLVHALNTQARLNKDATAREVERDRCQAEWNALHYEIVQRLVTEIARVSIEMQSLTLRVESLSAKVDFNERRVRGIENVAHQARPARGGEQRGSEQRGGEQRIGEQRGGEQRGEPRGNDARPPEARTAEPREREPREPREPREREPRERDTREREPRPAEVRTSDTATGAPAAAEAPAAGAPVDGSAPVEATRRKRRRRRGRRSGSGLAESGSLAPVDQGAGGDDGDETEGTEGENGDSEVADTPAAAATAAEQLTTADAAPDSAPDANRGDESAAPFETALTATPAEAASAPAADFAVTDESGHTPIETRVSEAGAEPVQDEAAAIETTDNTSSVLPEHHQPDAAPAPPVAEVHQSPPPDDPGAPVVPSPTDPGPRDR